MTIPQKNRENSLQEEIISLKLKIEELQTRFQQTEASLRLKNDDYYRTLFQEAPLPYQSLNQEGLIITVNKAWLDLFGFENNEVVGCNIANFLTEDSRAILKEKFPVFIKNGFIKGVEFEFVRKDNQKVYVSVDGKIQYNKNGKLHATHCILSDITLQRKNEKLLRDLRHLTKETEAKYRFLVENQNDYIVKVDTEVRFLYVSPGFCRLFGKGEEELIGNSFYSLVHEDDRESLSKAIEKLSSAPYTCYLELRSMTCNGWRWFAWNNKAVLDENENILSIVGVGRDITARKEVENQLRESENRLSGVLEAINHGVWDWRIDTNEVYFDDRFYQLAGYNQGDFKNDFSEWQKRIHPDDIGRCLKSLQKHLKDGRSIFDCEFRFLKKDGDWIWIRNRGKLMEWDSEGRPLRMLGTHSDITKRKKVEAELQDRDSKMANLMSKIPGMAYRCQCDLSWTMEYLSEGCLGLTGYKPSDFINNNKIAFSEVILPEYREELWQEWNYILSTSNTFNDEYQIMTKEGVVKWVWEQGSGIKGPDGTIIGLEGIILDITERKRAELIHQFQYKVAMHLVTSGNVKEFLDVVHGEIRKIFDFDGLVVGNLDIKRGVFQTLYEVGQEEGFETWPVEKSLSGIVIQQKKGMLFTDEMILDLVKEEKIVLYGTLSKVWMGVPLIYEGNVIGIIFVQNYRNRLAYDHTSLQVMEIIASQLSIYIEEKRALMRTSLLSQGIEQSPVAIVITDNKGIIEYVNPRFTSVTGYTADEVIGKNPGMLKSGEHSPEFYRNLWQTILSFNNWEGEIHNIRKNGEDYWEKNIISPIINEKREIVQFIAFKEDITETRNLMTDLVKAKERAEESDRLKSAFLANLSHEIRTPMNAILGFTELLQDPELTMDTIANYVAIIHHSGYHLLGIINDIIEISKIEVGQISPKYALFDIGALIRNLYETLKVTIPDNRDVVLKIDPPESINQRMIYTDEVKLTQIFTNLISNALKFTNKGLVRFGYVEKDGFLEFSVKDTGIGIDEVNHRLIFDRFYQVDSDLRIKGGGSGLGLAISKAYIEMLGGTITVQSKLGEGATFIFTIAIVLAHE